MMKALLVGGPKNGDAVHIKAGVDIRTFHEGKQLQYRRTVFVRDGISWYIWTHGDPPADDVIFQMIQKAEIPAITA